MRKEKDAEVESSSDSSFLPKFMKDQNDVKIGSNLKVVDEVKTSEEVKEDDNNDTKVDTAKNDEIPDVSSETAVICIDKALSNYVVLEV